MLIEKENAIGFIVLFNTIIYNKLSHQKIIILNNKISSFKHKCCNATLCASTSTFDISIFM